MDFVYNAIDMNTILIVALVLVALTFGTVLLLCIRSKILKKRVKGISKRIKALDKLRNEIVPNLGYTHSIVARYACGSKKEFDKSDVDALAKANAHRLLEPYSIKTENLFKQDEFQRHAERIYQSCPPSEEDVRACKMSKKRFLKIETQEFNLHSRFPKDDIDVTLQAIISYTSPAGRNHYENSKTYRPEQFGLKIREFEPIPFEIPGFDVSVAPKEEETPKEAKIDDVLYRLGKDEATLISGKEAKGIIKLPSQIEGLPLRKIAQDAFLENKALESIALPTTVVEIGERAFKACAALKEVKLNEGLKSIKERAFQGCESLIKANLPKSLTELGGEAFSSCPSLKSIVLPESLDYVGPGAFWLSDALKIKSPLLEEKPTWDKSWNNEEKEVKWGYQSSK